MPFSFLTYADAIKPYILAALLLHSFCPFSAHADAIPQDLELWLKPGPTLCCSPDTIAIELIIKNTSRHSASIIVPGQPNKALQLFDVILYERTPETMKWVYVNNLLPIDNPQLADNKRHETFWILKAGDEFKQLLFIKKPDRKHFALQVCYRPAVSRWYRYAFVDYDEEGTPDSTVNLKEHPDLLRAQGSFFSNLCELPIAATPPHTPHGSVERAIYERKNGKLLRLLRHGKTLPKQWPVLNDQLYSQAVQSSLSTYSHQYLTVDTRHGVQHLQLNYQLGKIYRFRSRMASIAHMLGARKVFWKTSDVDKTRLLSVIKV